MTSCIAFHAQQNIEKFSIQTVVLIFEYKSLFCIIYSWTHNSNTVIINSPLFQTQNHFP